MEDVIAKLLQDFEQGKMNRRQLVRSLAVAAAAASAVSPPAAAAERKGMKALNFNHVSMSVADYAKSRDFYADLFGMKVAEDDGKKCRLLFGDNILIVRTGPPPVHVDHIAYTLADWDKQKEGVEADLKTRKLKIVRGDVKTGYDFLDPDGFDVQIGGTRQ